MKFMMPETTQEELDDLKKRAELQQRLQEVVRRSGSAAEIRKVQDQIQELNQKLESYASRVRRP